MYFRIYYNLKFIIARPQIKPHTKTHNTAQNCTTKCTMCCTIKCIGNLNFLCILVLLNRRKIKFTSSIKYSNYQHRHCTNLVNTNRFIKCAT